MNNFFHSLKEFKPLFQSKELLKEALDLSEKECYNDIAKCYKLKNNITEVGFNSSCFKKYCNDEELYFDIINNSDIKDGIYQCKKCLSKKIYTFSKQTRRSDEATTAFAICCNCRNKWVLN